MAERNEALLRKVGDYIAEHPERYNQMWWFDGGGKRFSGPDVLSPEQAVSCGSTCCLAGTAVQYVEGFEGFVLQGLRFGGDQAVVNGERRSIRNAAQEALGLDGPEATALFHGDWRPDGYREKPLVEAVRDALYALADGASVEEVSF